MNRGKFSKAFKKEDGAGLVLALMVLMVLAVLGVAVAGVTIGSHKLGAISRDSNSAFYIAEAGANLAYDEIESGVWGKYSDSGSDIIFYNNVDTLVSAFNNPETLYGAGVFNEQFGDQPQAKVTVISDDGAIDPHVGKEYKIISEGMISGKTRTVEKIFIVKWISKGGGIGLPKPPEGAALLAGSTLNYQNNTPTIVGNIYLAPGAKEVRIKENYDTQIYEPGMQPYKNLINYFPGLPQDYTLYPKSYSGNTISESTYITTLTTTDTLTIRTTEGEILNLVVDNLKVGGDIKIIGSGVVNLYVRKSMEFIKAAIINNGSTPQEVEQLNILYSGSKDITFAHSMIFNGSIFVENKNVTMTIANHVTVRGLFLFFGKHIYFGNIPKDNNFTEASIYAPNSSIKFQAHADVRGTIIADSIELTNQSQVKYKENEFIETYLFGDGSGGPGGPGTETGPGDEVIEGNLITAGPALEP